MSGSKSARTERTGVRFAVASVLAGGLAGFLFGGASIGLVREQLHLSCSMGAPGGEGADTWTCADGIGYLGVAVILGLMWFVAVVVGGLVALLVRSDLAARVCLVVLAAASVAWILGIVAPVAVVVAIVLQPGLMVCLAPAMGLLAAAAARGSDPTVRSRGSRGVALS